MDALSRLGVQVCCCDVTPDYSYCSLAFSSGVNRNDPFALRGVNATQAIVVTCGSSRALSKIKIEYDPTHMAPFESNPGARSYEMVQPTDCPFTRDLRGNVRGDDRRNPHLRILLIVLDVYRRLTYLKARRGGADRC